MLMNEAGELIHTSVHHQRGQHRYKHVWDTFIYGNMVSGCTIVMNPAMKSIMAALPPQRYFIYDAWLAMAAFGFGKIAQLPQPLIHYRQHAQNVTFADHRARNRMERWINHWQNSWKANLRWRWAVLKLIKSKLICKISGILLLLHDLRISLARIFCHQIREGSCHIERKAL
jgi:hypothetical protein